MRHFREQYRQCMAKLKELLGRGSAEARKVIFPFGTLLMRTRHGYRCEPAELTWCILAHAPP